ncbi:hypothetical protein CCYA_CCYA20G4823 [Cyanidiococcus yangmingshanensis]|nr:hypothetical protein CCYA_CCYA20G4823 [Cyanidiococcus yangmingshanensis]
MFRRGMQSWGLVWFRNDLRLRDHEAFVTACKEHDGRVIPIYVFDGRQVGPGAKTAVGGFSKCSTPRAQFLLDAVQDLEDTLRQRYHGMQLIIYQNAYPEEVIPALITRLGSEKRVHITAVYYHQEVCVEEKAVEEALKDSLTNLYGHENATAVACRALRGSNTLYHPDDLPPTASVAALPPVFTTWRKLVERYGQVRAPLAMVEPSQVHPLPFSIPCDRVPSSVRDLIGENCEQERFRQQLTWSLPTFSDMRMDARNAFPFRGGETAAQERLQAYTFGSDAIARYKETRNGLVGTEYSTKWSPYLAIGNITPRQIYHTLRQYEEMRPEKKGVSTYWAVFELEWRDFFRFAAMRYGNALFWRSGLRAVIQFELDNSSKHRRWRQDPVMLKTWQCGLTGFPFVDANQRELLATGWMSNRGRQNVASFLAKDLELDWRLGAEWFESLLLDYDPCSNYGNWQYCAGVGLDPRADRHFDVIRQARMYDPDGTFMAQWLPELASCTNWFDIPRIHSQYPHYPRPVVSRLNRGRKQIDAGFADRPKQVASEGSSQDRRRKPLAGARQREPRWMRRTHSGPADTMDTKTSSSEAKQTVLDHFGWSSKQRR